MYLLKRLPRSNFKLIYFRDNETPPYAILSHTWGEESEEVTFDDIKNGKARLKANFKKINFCAEQAAQDDLQYFWVDSCCINRAVPPELQHAISSMFRWYQCSTKCYAYLSDVHYQEGENTWKQAFRQSKWFTRGWTLQELLAPTSVEFFSVEYHRLGDKLSLEKHIHEITRIPSLALQGTLLSHFNVDERLLWTNGRQTKIAEDMVYSLLGIFGIDMPLSYGEGWASAYNRLMATINRMERCIQDLRLTDPRDEKKRIEYEKGGLLKSSYRWIIESSQFEHWHKDPGSRLLWIKGDPGKGKTMLICGIIDELNILRTNSALISFCFCLASDARNNGATAVLRSLIYMLVCQQPSFASYIRNKYDTAGKSVFEDINAWFTLCDMFTDILKDPKSENTYLIIDALDECAAKDLPRLLELIVANLSTSHRVKWIVSSRNWPSIEQRLKTVKQGIWLCLELNKKSISTAVDFYVDFQVNRLATDNGYTKDTYDAVRRYLVSNAGSTFLWVALVCQRLVDIPGWEAEDECKAFPPGLEPLYQRMLQQISDSSSVVLCKQVLAIMSLMYRPISLDELAVFINTSSQRSRGYNVLPGIVKRCGSFLTVQRDTISFVHQSAKEFLAQKAYNEMYPSGVDLLHYAIFSKSMRVMSKLKRDIYGLGAPGMSIDDIKQSDPDLLSPARYACVYWISHLLLCNPIHNAADDLRDGGSIDMFLRQCCLYWLEALSLCRSIPEGLASMRRLETFLQAQTGSDRVAEVTKDVTRFVMFHKQPIQNSPLQTYVSALLFSPTSSLITHLFSKESPSWMPMRPYVGDDWSPCLQTLEGHSNLVSSVALSHDSTRLASASFDHTIKIWDNYGECIRTLKDDGGMVLSVAFAHDSARLASVSADKKMKVWNTDSGECLQIFESHEHGYRSVTFSHDSRQLASSSVDGTIAIWNADTGEKTQILKGHNSCVDSLAFSHHSVRLVSSSDDKTARIWNAYSGICLQTLEGHTAGVNSAVFSHDSIRIASASNDFTIRIWDAETGGHLQTLEDDDIVGAALFLYNSTRLASASGDRTIKIWDSANGVCLQTLASHFSLISSLALSSDSTRLVSGSYDNTIKIWDTKTGKQSPMYESHSELVSSMTFSHDLMRLASASHDHTIRIWDTCDGKCLQTLRGHDNWVVSVMFSYDSKRLASASTDSTSKIWHVDSGSCLQTIKPRKGPMASAALSYDSKRLLTASGYSRSIQMWEIDRCECLHDFEHPSYVNLAVFSYNSARIASASIYRGFKIWDTDTGECLWTYDSEGITVCSLAFSHDSRKLASAAKDNMVKIWVIDNGACVQTLTIGHVIYSLSFDITDSCLYTDYGTIDLAAFSASSVTTSLHNQKAAKYKGAGVSPDDEWITYDSANLIWLPPEHRPYRSVVSGNMIGIGAKSGKVWICDLRKVQDAPRW